MSLEREKEREGGRIVIVRRGGSCGASSREDARFSFHSSVGG